MKLNYALLSRSLIALLFVFAGVHKLMDFTNTVGFVGKLGVPLPLLATIIVILVEVPVALAFAWGYRMCMTGMILAGFTLIATALVHNNFPADLVMALKNVAIIGGIMAAMCMCECGKCPMGMSCANCKGGKCDEHNK